MNIIHTVWSLQRNSTTRCFLLSKVWIAKYSSTSERRRVPLRDPGTLVHNNGTKGLRGYFRFLQASGALCKHKRNMVWSADWGQDKNCTLFMFDNSANGCADSPVMNPKQSGEVQIVLNFGTAPGVNITIILYGEFENLLEIEEQSRVVRYLSTLKSHGKSNLEQCAVGLSSNSRSSVETSFLWYSGLRSITLSPLKALA